MLNMRILFLTHSFNSLCQRLFLELSERGHEVSIEFDINDAVTIEAVQLFKPELIVAPFLKRAIPESIWRHHLCLVIHPGIKGDRGPSALDWAIMHSEQIWGVTILQANGEMDAGDIWASVKFPMRATRKSSLYRNEVTEAATDALLQAIERFERDDFIPEPLDYSRKDVRGMSRPFMHQTARTITWELDSTAVVIQKIRAADGFPGVLDTLYGQLYYLYNAYEEETLTGVPGAVIAQRHGAICKATVDGAVWITHLKKKVVGEKRYKLPAAAALGERLSQVPESIAPLHAIKRRKTYTEIHYEEKNQIGYLHFDFYNGAMSTEQCIRLLDAYHYAQQRNTRIILLMGGPDFWSNGIHLNIIEAAESPADESWRNINAMNDLARTIITTDTHLTISALQGNAAAGGVFLALAADWVYARSGVVLNPHYKSMGNLYGSEYWTYLLPKRVGKLEANALTDKRLPIGTRAAKQLGLIDDQFGKDAKAFQHRIQQIAEQLAIHPDYSGMLKQKQQRLVQAERERPLERYRTEEMEHMKLNFYGFDPSYHVARHNFVCKIPHSWTPLYLARHRSIQHLETCIQRQSRG